MEKLSEAVVKSLAAGKTHYYPGAEISGGGKAPAPRGFGIRVTPAGCRSYVLRYSIANRERLMVIGQCNDWSLIDAVKKARQLRMRVDAGDDPLTEREKEAEKAKTKLQAVFEDYLAREGSELASHDEIESVFKRLVFPELGNRDIADVRRGDIMRLIGKIRGDNGPAMAHHTFAYVRTVFNWHAVNTDDFNTPFVPNMLKTLKIKPGVRQRVLLDGELRALWNAPLDTPFNRMVRFILLTCARCDEAASMPWDELKEGIWLLPQERQKKTGLELARPLCDAALAVLPPRRGTYVFSTDGGVTPISGFSKMKKALQADSGTAGWALHDLRRTADTTMARADVPRDYIERCMGHVKPGIRKHYDCWQYVPQMRRAYEALAGCYDGIRTAA